MFPQGTLGLGSAAQSRSSYSMDSSRVMSWMGFIMLARSFIPLELVNLIRQFWALFLQPYSKLFCVFHIHEHSEQNDDKNDLFDLVKTYMEVSGLCKGADNMILTTQHKKEKDIKFRIKGGESVEDSFKGVLVWWSLVSSQNASQREDNSRRNSGQKSSDKSPAEFVLKMRKTDKKLIMTEYLDHIVKKVEEFKHQQRDLALYANNGRNWRSYLFNHPSTFDNLAMDPKLKADVKADLDAFRQSENYFRRVGRAWKRGYLLYGPPGTGKTSMIAAIANYLKYDVYDLELTQVYSNDDLKRLLFNTTSKSIVVIEDIDCSLNLSGNRNPKPVEEPSFSKKRRMNGGRGFRRMNGGRGFVKSSAVTLSGLLNSTDGLWSSGVDERIIIFTTNHVDMLDPALIRPGRMDIQILMSFCSFESFKELASSYLRIDSHSSYETVRRLLEEDGVLVTPAQVTEHMLGKHDDPSAAINSLLAELHRLQALIASKP